MALDSIRSLVEADLEATDHFIINELKSEIPLINDLIEHIIKCGGKRIRPLLVLLSSRAFNHQEKEPITLAAAIELIHTATLLHDDVVDSADLRRGQKTANALWGNEASVLVGDFLYSRAFQLIVSLQNLDVINIFSEATNIIAEGEVLQLINCHNPNTTEKAYYDVILRKTAKLFEVAAQAGTALTTHSPQQIQAMKNYGMHLGLAYQLIDDAIDYQSSTAELGKNRGNDLAEGKPTLPLIHALSKGTSSETALIKKAIKTGSTKDLDSIFAIIESTGAIQYTAEAAKKHALAATATLTHLPETPYRKALHDLSEFVVERSF